MNQKIKKLQAERKKNEEKITVLKGRNADIDKQIIELENLDIIGLVRSKGMTTEQLAALMQSQGRAFFENTQREDMDNEEI